MGSWNVKGGERVSVFILALGGSGGSPLLPPEVLAMIDLEINCSTGKAGRNCSEMK